MKTTEYIDLVEKLEVYNLQLEGELATCRELRDKGEGKVRKAAALLGLAREFADEYEKHPWASSTVYEAGRDLMAAIRKAE